MPFVILFTVCCLCCSHYLLFTIPHRRSCLFIVSYILIWVLRYELTGFCYPHLSLLSPLFSHLLFFSLFSFALPYVVVLTIFCSLFLCCYFFLLPILFVVLSTFCHSCCFLLYSLFSTPTTLCYLVRFCRSHYHLSSVVLSKHSVDLTNFCCSFCFLLFSQLSAVLTSLWLWHCSLFS
jgi:hypothetical protein